MSFILMYVFRPRKTILTQRNLHMIGIEATDRSLNIFIKKVMPLPASVSATYEVTDPNTKSTEIAVFEGSNASAILNQSILS